MTNEGRIRQLKEWDVQYHGLDAPAVSDAVYDAFKDETRKLAPNDPYFRTVGAAPVSEWQKTGHDGFPMGSLNKVQTIEELRAWRPATQWTTHVSLKGDGISLRLRYERGEFVQGVTRGDGEVGEDITPNVRKMQGVPLRVPGFTGNVRGEITLKKSVFAKHFKDLGYKNCRNAAGGAAKKYSGEKCGFLNVICYVMRPDSSAYPTKEAEFTALRAAGFDTPGGECLTSPDEIETLRLEYIDGKRDALDYDIDGLVIEINDTEVREAMGEVDGCPAGAVAFKFPHMTAETTLRDVEWQVGASGRITPVAIFDEVVLAGASVTRASLHNVANIYRLHLKGVATGDVVVVSRRNDVIPYVESVVTRGKAFVVIPTICPACRAELKMEGEYLVCPDTLGCPHQTVGRLERWITKVGVKDFGGALIEALWHADMISEPAHLYKLSPERVAEMRLASERRVGLSAATTAIKNLRAKMDLPLHVLVGSLGIPLWSRSMCKVLVSAGYDTLGKMRDAKVADLIRVDGVEETKAKAFVTGFKAVEPQINNLLEAGVTIMTKSTGSMTGKTMCMTGFRDAELSSAFEAAGGTVKSSVVKGLTYLVAKDPNGSSGKLEKARAGGTVVVGIDEMRALLK